jgi:hypothetical protein
LFGRAVILFGDATEPPATVTAGDLDGSNGFRLEPGSIGGRLVSGAGAAGEFNGDGISDIAFGSIRLFTPPDGDNLAEAIIILGSNPTPAFDASENATDITDGRFAGSGLGGSLAFADINGDGIDDFVMGAPFTNRDADRQVGEVVVVFGGATVTGEVDISALDGTDGFILAGVNEFDRTDHTILLRISAISTVTGSTTSPFPRRTASATVESTKAVAEYMSSLAPTLDAMLGLILIRSTVLMVFASLHLIHKKAFRKHSLVAISMATGLATSRLDCRKGVSLADCAANSMLYSGPTLLRMRIST